MLLDGDGGASKLIPAARQWTYLKRPLHTATVFCFEENLSHCCYNGKRGFKGLEGLR